MASDDISEMIHDFEYNRCMDVLDKKFAPKRPAPKAKVAKVTKQRGRKKVMDPDQPKCPTSSYFYYGAEVRPALLEATGLPMTEVNKQIGAQWDALAVQEKQKYEDMAVQDRRRYRAELKNYKPSAEWATPPKKTRRKSVNKELDEDEIEDLEDDE